MAGKSLQWVFEILDKMSGPGQKMAKAMGNLDKGIHGAGDKAKHAAGHFGGLRHALFETLEIAHRLAEGLHFVGEKVFEFGKEAIGAATFKEDMELSLKYLLGSKEAAKEVFEQAEKLAFRTGRDPRQFVNFAAQLARAFNPQEVGVLMETMGDLSVINPAGMESFVETMRLVRSEGFATERQIRALDVAGIRGQYVYEELGKIFGLTGDGVIELSRQIREGGRQIEASPFLLAAERAAARVSGGVGAALKEGSGTLSADLQRMNNLTEQFFDQLAGGPGFKAFRGVIGNLVKMMSPGGPLGKTITDLVNGPLAQFLQQFTGPEGAKKLQEIFQTILDIVVKLTTAIKDMIAVAISGLRAFGYNVGEPTAAEKMGAAIQNLFSGPDKPAFMNKPAGVPVYGPPAPVSPPPAKGGKDKVGFNMNINVNAPGATMETVQALRDAIRQEAAPVLAQALEAIATEGGLA